MKKTYQKIFVAVLALLMVLSMTACSSSTLIDPAVFNPEHESKNVKTTTTYAENEQYQLIWDADFKRILLYDKQHDRTWTTAPKDVQNPGLDEYGTPADNHPKLETPLIVEYIETENFSLKTANAYTTCLKSHSKGNYSLEKIDNGFRITYYFDSLKFSIPIEYTLNKDSISISVVSEEISEGDENLLYRVLISPFMCSVPNIKDDAYLFYPSGSGSLIYADNSDEISTVLSEQVYGLDMSYFPYRSVMTSSTEKLRMPVFGVKDGNEGMLGIITKGADTAIIETDVGNETIGYSSVFATFNIRGRQTTAKSQNGVQYTEQFTTSPMEVTYYPLYDENASYVGMANRYRTYLEENYGMKDQTETASTSVSLIGGVSVAASFLGNPTSRVVPLTTIDAAKNILIELKSTLGLPIVAELFGFGSSGVSIGKPAGDFKIAKSLGSKKQLTTLSSSCKENDISLFFNYDLVYFAANGSGLTMTRGGSVKGPAHTYARQRTFQLGTGNTQSFYYEVARSELPGLAAKAVNNCNDFTVEGFASRSLTNVSYSDCTENKYIVKGNMATDVTEILNGAHENGLKVLGYDANDYAAVQSDAIMGTPVTSSHYDICDVDVPFYQIVFKGYVPMYGPALNTTTNDKENILRCVECGVGLNYSLTDTFDIDTITSEYQMFVNTVYSDIKDTIVNSVNETKSLYEAIADAKIVGHQILSGDVRKVSYDNGITVYVNYGDSAYESTLGSVAARSFVYGKEAE